MNIDGLLDKARELDWYVMRSNVDCIFSQSSPYCIHHWDGKLELTAEINGGIKQLVAFTSVRKEVAFG